MVQNHALVGNRNVELLGQDLCSLILGVHAIIGDEKVWHTAVMHFLQRFLRVWQQVPASDQYTVYIEDKTELRQALRHAVRARSDGVSGTDTTVATLTQVA